jgi:hypothetical protein
MLRDASGGAMRKTNQESRPVARCARE